VGLDGGLASGSPGTGPAIGARLTFDLGDRLALEGSGEWLSRGDGAHGSSVAASLLVDLTDRKRTAVPYLAVGGGIYGAMSGMGSGRFFGNMDAQYSGSQTTGMHGVGSMQGAYDGGWNTRSSTDPAISLGGGLRMDVSDRVFVRPDVRALVAFADGRSYTTALVTVGVGYRF
jgi:hypothetical protein